MARRRLEHGEQKNLIRWADLNSAAHPSLKRLFAIPNGGWRSKAEAGMFKAEGVRRGVPDLFLPIPFGGFAGLFIEMKVKPNKPTAEQREWLSFLRTAGYRTSVCFDWPEAAAVIIDYLELPIEKP